MHGIIFVELKKYVDAKVGPGAWDKLLGMAGMPAHIFMPVRQYPDEDVVKLVTAAAKATGAEVDAILEDFGAFIAPDLLRLYAALIQPEWRTLDVVQHTEETVHRVVRLRNPGAAPPYLRAERTSPDEVVVHYTSQRKLCAIAKGIVRGVSTHFGDGVTILETECMHRGAAECRIVVRRPAPS